MSSAGKSTRKVLHFAVGGALLGGIAPGCASRDKDIHVNEGPEPEPKFAPNPGPEELEGKQTPPEVDEHVNEGPEPEPTADTATPDDKPNADDVNPGPVDEPHPKPTAKVNPGPEPVTPTPKTVNTQKVKDPGQ